MTQNKLLGLLSEDSSFQNKFTVRNAREKVKGSKEKEMEGVGKCSQTGQGLTQSAFLLPLQQLTIGPWEFPRELAVRTLAFSDVAWVPGLGSRPGRGTKSCKPHSEANKIKQ